MPLTRLDNLISSKTGKYLYVSPDDFNATDALSNRGNSPITPFKSIQRAFLEIARYSYLPGKDNDRFDQFSIMLMPGIHYIDNRPGLVDTNGISEFGFDQALNAWTDNSILDISNPDNVLWKFNNTEGGAIIPRGSSLVGYDLRRTTIRPLYVPDPASVTVPRSAIFNVTGGCYFWQFTIKDGQTTSESPLYNVAEGTGEVYYDPYDFTRKTAPNFSHHKLTVFEYADTEELSLFYRKISKAFAAYQPTIDDPGEFDFRVQENRIVGPLSDSRVIESLKFVDATTDPSVPASTTEVTVTTKVDHGYFAGQFVSITNTQIDDVLEGFFPIKEIDPNDPRKFVYEVPVVVGAIGTNIVSGQTISVDTTPALGQNAQTLAEVDSVESASPYVFNVSIRSTWGICGIWANGLKATGFRSMVIAQYTGVSLQLDDRAFIRYDEYSNTWNQASLVDAFATVPYHAKGDSYWKDEWRNFHVRASEDAFIQNVSIFAVGFADHFLMETGGDMSITNSNSNFGNTSLHAIGFKGFSFNQDKAGYITDIIPPKKAIENTTTTKRVAYYTIDIQGTIQNANNYTKLFLGSDDIITPTTRPAATIDGFRLGAKSNDKLYVKLGSLTPGGNEIFEVELQPTGFVKYIAKGSILNPSGIAINSISADAANLIESNRTMIQEEVFGYILEKYPALQNIPYVNPGLDPAAGRYFDARNLILNNRQEIVDTAFNEMVATYGLANIQGVANGKCKRDIGLIVDAIAEDLRDGGNKNIIDATKTYFSGNGTPIANGLVGEEVYSVYAFNRARDLCKKAVANLLTVKATIYDPETNSVFNKPGNPYGYVFGNYGSSLGLNSSGVTVDASNKENPAGRNRTARNRIVANREFILDAALAEVSVYHPDFQIPGDPANNNQSRFADGFRLIRRNSKEILDRALAKIAVDFPNFYFPGDPQTTVDSRFYDSHRLIQQNRQHIIDRAAAEIAVQHPDFYYPGDPATTAVSRFKDAYRLIQQNRTAIIDTAFAAIAPAFPTFVINATNTAKCKRDIGIFVDSVSLDIAQGGGNVYSRQFVLSYFNNGTPITNGLVGEEAQSVVAFQKARDEMNKAVANQLAIKDLTITADPAPGSGAVSNTNPTSCANVQAAITSLSLIVTDIITAGSIAALPAESVSTTVPAGEAKCKRDIGIFIDAISLDLFVRGNEYAYKFSAEYFTNATTLLPNGLVNEIGESITAFNKARDVMKLAITNQLFTKDLTITADPSPSSGSPSNVNPDSCANVKAAIDTLTTLVTTILTNGNLSSMPQTINKGSSPAGMKKCARDIGYFIDAVAIDVFTGGNKHTREFVKQYFTNATTPLPNGLVGEILESNVAFNEAAEYMRKAVVNALYHKDLTITADPSPTSGAVGNQNVNNCNNVRAAITTLATLVTSTLTAGNLNNLPVENAGTLLAGETKCRRDIGIVVDAIAQDLWFGGNEYTIAATKEYFTNATTPLPNGLVNEIAMSITAFKRAADLMNRAINNQYYDKDFTITLDTVGDPVVVADIHADAHDLVMNNKEFIAKEAYLRMKLAYPNYVPQTGNTEQDCLDDVYDVLREVMWDVKFGGNSKTYDTANIYVTNTYQGQTIQTFIDSERDEAAKVFLEAKKVAIQVLRNETVAVTTGNTFTQKKDLTIVTDWDADELLPKCGSAVGAVDTLFGILLQAVGNDSGVGNLTGITRTAPAQPTTYSIGNCSDVLSTIDTLTGILCDALYAGNLSTLPPLSNGEWDCANVRASIENLFDIVTDAVGSGSLAGLPIVNSGDFIANGRLSKCYRDVSFIVDAVVNDLRLGGNVNSIQAGEAYYVGNNLTYIDGEKSETIDAWNYVGDIAIAAMRNFDFLAVNCVTTAGSALVNVGDSRGIPIGMRVVEYANTPTPFVNGLLQTGAVPIYTNIPKDTFVKRIVSSTVIELGVANSRFTFGSTVNALQSSTTTKLYFTFEKGAWADTLPKKVKVGPANTNPDVIQDTTAFTPTAPTQRECASTANAIITLVGNITTIINSGLGTVALQEQTVNTALFASRATIFTIDTTGYGSTNAHNFETGTPVRLVPRPRFDITTGKYVEVDKRLVRLPKGFETNRTYYVIAPGRRTQPEDYSSTTFFNGSDQTKLMLATSKENAAAGIFIYASETQSIDPNVEIDLYQFVLDDKYDLHTYKCNLTNTVNAGIETDVSHIFDKPSAATTPHKVFFRAVEGGQLPIVASTYQNDPTVAVTNPQNANVGRINPQIEFFARYQNDKVFTIHKTHADAINNVNPIQFFAGQAGLKFDVYANKRRSPMKFDPSFTDTKATAGKWYIQCKDVVTGGTPSDIAKSIFSRINQSDYSDRPRTTDMWYQRLDDKRAADDRTYKIRYVIPKYLENARDPINGFVLKTRTDDTRKLIPQKIVLKPVTGSVYGARFENPVQAGEYIGYTAAQFTSNNLNSDAAYDPFKKDLTNQGIDYRAFAKFSSGIQATIQSGRYVADSLNPSIKYLELTVYDHTVDALNFPGLRNEIFTTVKITSPQGGDFVPNKTQSINTNKVFFTGNSSGSAYIHAYMSVGGDHYLIIKGIAGGKLEYSEFFNTRFTQGTVFADMIEDQDMGKSLPLKTLIRKRYPEYYWRQNGANVYTITPGDKIQDDAGIEYYVDSVEDAGVIEDTFYIFATQTLQRRISGQQDGIYYLTCLRGNISPFPTGAGVINNFRNFKFSQPVSRLYPLNYRNDPLWFQKNGTTNEEKNYYAALIDPPAALSAADNYIHGLVTVNDFKNSVTRETIGDLIKQPAFVENTYSGTVVKYGKTLNSSIQAQDGNATSGSEDRIIPISGNSTVVTDQRYYVELRRPSIARAGNHTFEYLGFGPGNYSTGLPARQEVVLTPDQDFYAQAKKQDAGIVFYTGINSQGDLYIGNRRINAITGEETFIDKASLTDDGDANDVVGGLVTTFDTPVTFNENFTVVGGDGSLITTFESPVVVSVQDNDLTQERNSLIIRSNVSSVDPVTNLEQDEGLDRTQFAPVSKGDITLGKNRIQSAIFAFSSRGKGQEYLIQTHSVVGIASNLTPNQSPVYDPTTGIGTAIPGTGIPGFPGNQFVTYGNTVTGGLLPTTGDILLKGSEIGKTGSLGFILSNYYQTIPNGSIENVIFDGSTTVKVTFRSISTGLPIACQDIGITSASQIRFKNYPDVNLNLTWTIYSPTGDAFSPTKPYIYVQIFAQRPALVQSWADLITQATNANNPLPTIEFSNSNWKEVGVLGAEALRTETETIGNYKLGINTVARSPHDAHKNAFVDSATTDPRANLDVVGNAYISGKKTTNYLQHPNFANRNKNAIADAFVVGGDSASPTDYSTLRVDTNTVAITEASRGNNLGRVGINTDQTVTNKQLNRALVVVGDSRFTEDARFQRDIEVYTDGGTDTAEIRTGITTGNFNLLNGSTTTQFTGQLSITAGVLSKANSKGLRLGNNLAYIEIGDVYTDDQFIFIGNNSDHSNILIGDISDAADKISKISIGGAYGTNSSNSFTTFGTRRVNFAGDVLFGANKLQGGNRLNPEMVVTVGTEAGIVEFFTGNTQTLDFATNASEINIGGQGGQTKVRNNLLVDAAARFNSNIVLCGGFASFSFVGNRAQLGSTPFSHTSGILGSNTFNSNIDIVNVFVVNVVNQNIPTVAELAAGFNRIDTAGAGVWGGNSGTSNFQAAVPGAGPEGGTLPALTGLDYYMPVKYKPTPYFKAGDYVIVDTGITGTTHPEIVRITEDGLQGAETAPYYLKVRRQPLGTFTTIKSNHPDTTNIWKVNVAFDATWITQSIDASGVQENVYLAEFGGSLTTNDYVIIDREDTNNDGIADKGEVFKIASLLAQVAKKFSIKNGCDTAAEETVFEVDSTTGSVSLGDPGNINTNTFIYGNLTVTGQCGGAGTADNTKLTFKNELYTTAQIDICTGDAFFGSNFATVFVVGAFYGTTAAAHTTTTPVHVYRRDPFSIQAAGPLTTILATQQTGSVTPATSNIPIATNLAAFNKGDLVAIVDGISKVEIIQITDTPYTDSNGNKLLPTSTNAIYPTGGRGKESTTAQSWNSGAIVVRIQKDPRTTTLAEAIPATGRISVEAPNINPNKIRIKLVNGDLIAEKLDYEYFVRIDNEFFYPDSKNSANDPVYGVRLPKSYRDPVTGDIEKFFGGGDLTSHGSLNITSGNIRVYGTDGTTLVFNVTNDDGHPGDGAIVDELTGRNGMYLKGFANIYGNLQVYNEQCQENGYCDNKLVFKVDRGTGKVDMGESLYIQGQVFGTESASTPILHIDNLGSAGTGGTTGPRDFILYQDGSIDAFGIKQYFTANGGRRWTYVAQSATGIGQTQANPLQPNNNYLLNLTTGGNMVLYLPTNAVTGDIIRFIELTGNLSYNTNLVIRALKINNTATGIQGDVTGSKLTSGSGSGLLAQSWDSGELIIQTRNASFGLLFVGTTDAPNDPLASEIPSNLRGWWLVEL